MSALRYRYQTTEFGDFDIHFRSLRDRCQFADCDGEAAALGISSTAWPLFGLVWPSGEILAELMATYAVADKRILEIGCGVGLASLVLNARDADISATDRHPAAEALLNYNANLNEGPDIPFLRIAWEDARDHAFGKFDLIIGSDLLYEPQHPAQLSQFIATCARPVCEVVMVVAGRGFGGGLVREMTGLGFSHELMPVTNPVDNPEPYRGKIHRFRRNEPG